ncbi:acyltransferase family protein [Massilia aquatica]|uniref:Acyltransferase n=1 Tax=Massilia aquatica TaxID=2609000 RepID=A0ABX0LXE7_9BURK|nr:acyltransferase [Massilia aquatica]NHZ39506.1 acyltransferase [Massilia aquatica]
MKNPTSTARIEGMDTLRALAVTLVVLHHYVLFVSRADTFGWVGRIGWIGVDLFFALSGYLIGNQIFAAMRSPRAFSLARFYGRRALRTLPVFYVMLAIYYCSPWFRAGLELPPLWRFLTFTQNINLAPGTAFSHAWSLCIEEQFYLVLPALALAIASLRGSLRWSWGAIAVAIVAGMLVRATIWRELVVGHPHGSRNYYQYIYYSTLCRFDELVAGVALALLKNFHPRQWRSLTSNGNLACGAGMALLGLAIWLFLDERQGFGVTVFGYPLLALGFALLIVAALSRDSLLRTTRVPGAASMALWSYAIYLTHKQVCILAATPLREHGYGAGSPVAIGTMLALSVLSGWVLYRCVERPFMAVRARYLPTNFKPL